MSEPKPKKDFTTIHFVGGNRGRIGKSFYSSLLCHTYGSNNKTFTLFDTDTYKKDVSSMYGGITEVTFDACNEIMTNHSDDAIKVDRIYEESIKQDVIVNMPSDSHKELFFWLKQNGLDDANFLQEEKIRIYIWFLSNGEATSLQLLKKTTEDSGAFKVVLVRNEGIDHHWKNENSDYVELLKSIPKVKLETMPRGERIATFQSGKAYDTYKGNRLSQNRLNKYLTKQSAEILTQYSFKA